MFGTFQDKQISDCSLADQSQKNSLRFKTCTLVADTGEGTVVAAGFFVVHSLLRKCLETSLLLHSRYVTKQGSHFHPACRASCNTSLPLARLLLGSPV